MCVAAINPLMNRFIKVPTESDATEVERSFGFCLQDLIVLGIEDFLNIVQGAENAVVLEGLGKGENRMEEALEDMKVKSQLVMSGRDLFTSRKILIQVVMDENDPLVINEMEAVKALADEFGSDVEVTWGISRQILEEPYTAAIRLFASNIELI